MAENIFLFIPNIIGYVRILLTVTACYLMFTDPLKAAFCFSLSHTILDDLDGIAARIFKQATRFGGVFDVVIDRCSFMVWTMGLCVLYPQYTLLFQLNSLLDVMRMWMKVYSSSLAGKKNAKASHDYWILQFYYSDVAVVIVSSVSCHIYTTEGDVMATGCHDFYGSEMFFVMLHLCYFSPGPTLSLLGYTAGVWQIGAVVLFPLVIIKVPINLLILKVGCQGIAAVDLAERVR